MKVIVQGWLVLLAMIATVNPAIASGTDSVGTDVQDHKLIKGLDFTGTAKSDQGNVDSVAIRITRRNVQRQRVRVPVSLLNRIAVKAIQVGHSRQQAIQLRRIQVSDGQVQIIGHRIVTDLLPGQPQPAFWLEQVRVTFPRHYIAGSWDVQSLQRELERLGIKIKPKPAAPKPSVKQLAG